MNPILVHQINRTEPHIEYEYEIEISDIETLKLMKEFREMVGFSEGDKITYSPARITVEQKPKLKN